MAFYCKVCGKPRPIGRRYCNECYIQYNRNKAKKSYQLNGHTTYDLICQACNSSFISIRKTSKLCPECRKESITGTKLKYEYSNKDYKINTLKHRVIAEQILKRILDTDEIVHHLDANSRNNELSNLIVLSRIDHGRLHIYLREQKVILEKKTNLSWYNEVVSISLEYIISNKIQAIRLC